MSTKGQIIIPDEIRMSMGLLAGDQFVVIAGTDVVFLKRITQPSLDEFPSLIAKVRKQAKSAGFAKEELASVIKQNRKKK